LVRSQSIRTDLTKIEAICCLSNKSQWIYCHIFSIVRGGPNIIDNAKIPAPKLTHSRFRTPLNQPGPSDTSDSLRVGGSLKRLLMTFPIIFYNYKTSLRNYLKIYFHLDKISKISSLKKQLLFAFLKYLLFAFLLEILRQNPSKK
jgi:hypothetical protein